MAASSSASLLKSSSIVVDKSEFIKGQSLLLRQTQSSVSLLPNAPSSLSIRASSYAHELVNTAVPNLSYFLLLL